MVSLGRLLAVFLISNVSVCPLVSVGRMAVNMAWRNEPHQAAGHLLTHFRHICDQLGRDNELIPIILDGENCWEAYAEDGGPFLDQLYQALAASPDIRASATHAAPGVGQTSEQVRSDHSALCESLSGDVAGESVNVDGERGGVDGNHSLTEQ